MSLNVFDDVLQCSGKLPEWLTVGQNIAPQMGYCVVVSLKFISSFRTSGKEHLWFSVFPHQKWEEKVAMLVWKVIA